MGRPYKLITVSRNSENATNIVKALVDMLSDGHCIIHAANCESTSKYLAFVRKLIWEGLDEVRFRMRDLQPDMLVGTPELWKREWPDG